MSIQLLTYLLPRPLLLLKLCNSLYSNTNLSVCSLILVPTVPLPTFPTEPDSAVSSLTGSGVPPTSRTSSASVIRSSSPQIGPKRRFSDVILEENRSDTIIYLYYFCESILISLCRIWVQLISLFISAVGIQKTKRFIENRVKRLRVLLYRRGRAVCQQTTYRKDPVQCTLHLQELSWWVVQENWSCRLSDEKTDNVSRPLTHLETTAQ